MGNDVIPHGVQGRPGLIAALGVWDRHRQHAGLTSGTEVRIRAEIRIAVDPGLDPVDHLGDLGRWTLDDDVESTALIGEGGGQPVHPGHARQ